MEHTAHAARSQATEGGLALRQRAPASSLFRGWGAACPRQMAAAPRAWLPDPPLHQPERSLRRPCALCSRQEAAASSRSEGIGRGAGGHHRASAATPCPMSDFGPERTTRGIGTVKLPCAHCPATLRLAFTSAPWVRCRLTAFASPRSAASSSLQSQVRVIASVLLAGGLRINAGRATLTLC